MNLDYSDFLGRIAIAAYSAAHQPRHRRRHQQLSGKLESTRITKLYTFRASSATKPKAFSPATW